VLDASRPPLGYPVLTLLIGKVRFNFLKRVEGALMLTQLHLYFGGMELPRELNFIARSFYL
jgi:hypothetical protein